MSSVGKNLCIPEIGTVVTLTEDWQFGLYNEWRNSRLIEVLCPDVKPNWNVDVVKIVTLPKGTSLRVDRVYIRKGLTGFSSISFIVAGSEDPRFFETKTTKKKSETKLIRARFWAKLADVNMSKMEVTKDACDKDAIDDSLELI